MSADGPAVIAWFTTAEWNALFRHVGDEATHILHEARQRAKNAEPFGVFDAPRPACGECLQPEVDCRCHVYESRVLAFRGPEDS